jgi:DNA-directed RNA polymerase specialized sigma subunit
MDKPAAQKYISDTLFQEWLPDIHSNASSLANKYPDRVKTPHDLHHAGLLGLMSAIKNWNPQVAQASSNSFRTYANRCILGHMQDHVTGIHSFDKEGALDPGVERQSRQFAASQKYSAQKPEAETEQPSIPQVPKP